MWTEERERVPSPGWGGSSRGGSRVPGGPTAGGGAGCRGAGGLLPPASCPLHPGLSPAQGSWAPKKEPYAREMLAISFISAVNRKRKKRREARGLGSSTDDDSEQEADRKSVV